MESACLIIELIDSALEMMYETVLSPFLIIMNYNAKHVVLRQEGK